MKSYRDFSISSIDLEGAAPPEPTQRLPSIQQLQEKQTTPLNEIVKGKLSTKESQTEWQQLQWRQKWWLMMSGWLAEPQPNREQKKRREREKVWEIVDWKNWELQFFSFLE
jgi:hypothetical protein